MLPVFLILVLQSLIINSTTAARILAVFPVPSISHQVVFRTLTQKLVELGHDVTVVTTDPAFPKGQSPPNLREIDVHDMSYKMWKDIFMKTSKGNTGDLTKQAEIALEVITMVVDAQLENKEVQKLISDKNNTYDLLLLEAIARPALIYSNLFKAPVVAVSSFGATPWNYDVIGAPEHPIFYHNVFRLRLNNLTTWEKIKELYNSYQINKVFDDQIEFENNVLRNRFGPDTPGVEELTNNIDMLFLNTHPVFEGIRPVPPTVIYMGGLHQNPTKALPADLKNYLDSSKNGVVYVSFGTNVNSTLLPADKVQMLVKVFSKLPYNVLLKWDNEEVPGCSANIKIAKWLPQSDLLKHPNVKLFITQGGLQSTDEAITAGVPLIGIPMLGDQWHNVENYVRHGIGIKLDLDTLSEEQLSNAINLVIEDKNYRRNVSNMLKLITDQPMTPLERAVWWIEYLIRHGGAKHLRSPTANISWSQYLEINIILTVLAALLLVLTLSLASIYFLFKYININIKVKTL